MIHVFGILLSLCLMLPQGVIGDEKTQGAELPFKIDNVPDWQVRLELIDILMQQKKYDEAETEVGKVLKEKPNLLEAKLTLAEISFLKGNETRADEILNTLPPLKELSESQLLKLAYIKNLQENFDASEAIFENLLTKNPKNDLARYKYAETLSWDKKYEQSLNNYEILLKKYPENIQLRRKYAFVLIWMGKKDLAAEELRKTLPHD